MMRRAFQISVGAMVATFCLTIAAASASAEDGLNSILGEMRWGDSHSAVIESLEDDIMDEFRAEVSDLRDTARRDRIRQRYTERVNTIRETYKALTPGSDRGLNASIVYDEYATGNDEAILKVRDEVATRFFFFHKDRLYKIAVAYNPSYIGDLTFVQFAASVTRKYGDYEDMLVDDLERIVEVSWVDGSGTRLRVKDRSTGYGSFLMAFADEGIEAEVTPAHQRARQALADAEAVDSSIDDLALGAEDTFEAGAGSAVDDVLGTDTEINLYEHLPAEDIAALEKERAERERAAVANEQEELSRVRRSQSRTRETNSRRSNRRRQEIDASNASDGVIIY